jgi:multisubunit Na+/H+ antiporter MnhB subunit
MVGMIETHTLVAFVGVFVAVVMRTVLPYLQKVREASEKGEQFVSWRQRYIVTCVSALFTGFILSILTFPNLPIPAEPASLLYTFVLAFGYGWGINDAYNKILIDWR